MLSLINHVAGRPWAIHGEVATQVRGLVAREGLGALRHLAELKADLHTFDAGESMSAQAARQSRSGSRAVGVAVVPVIGTLTQRGDVINSVSTRSTDGVAAEVRAAAADPQADAIVLDVDSPGGEVFGVPEAFAAIREATKIKPVVAVANSFAASAAYYLASAADEIWVTPSGQVGSIGVYALHVDASAALEAAGEKWTFISAGKFKVEGNPAAELGEEAQASMQDMVDRYYDMFTRDVARGRGREIGVDAVRRGFGEGRMVLAKPAIDERMADEIGTLDDAIRRASQLGQARTSTAKAQRLAAVRLATNARG